MIKIWLYVLWFKPKPPGPLASKCNEWNCDFILTRLKMYWCKMIRNTIITLWVVVTLGGPDHVQVNWRCKSIFLDSILLFFYFGRWFSVKIKSQLLVCHLFLHTLTYLRIEKKGTWITFHFKTQFVWNIF